MTDSLSIPDILGKPAILALEDGTVFRGVSVGADTEAVAEVVFNTSMTGYQEILTDPSYKNQIVTLTYPHIGNTGINAEDVESAGVHVSGLVVRSCPSQYSNFRAGQSLGEYLTANNIPCIAEIDTRKLTRILRDKGAQGACIMTGNDADRAVKLAREFSGMSGQDLSSVVSVEQNTDWTQKTWQLQGGYADQSDHKYHVVAVDYGVKSNILRILADKGCKVTVVPPQSSAQDILSLNPDGVFLSNGPGDPAAATGILQTVKELLEQKLPTFGICMGHQLMGLAVGAKTVKMKTGHHGANHPVQDLDSKRVMITSQNHGFAVDADSLPENARVTHVSLFDCTLQGFELTDRPAFCFQGHPEASPGPHDAEVLFDKFIQLMAAAKSK